MASTQTSLGSANAAIAAKAANAANAVNATKEATIINIDPPNITNNDTNSVSSITLDNTIKNKNYVWKHEHETILAEWSDKAMCYRWMHFKSYKIFHRKVHMYTIPVIIISTLTGTANFATTSYKWEYTSSIIGAFNIIAGIVTTIQQFLKINELNESHRVASLSWDKFYRNIKNELAKHPDDRISAYQMMKIYKEEYDRLMETSPSITKTVINQFNAQFKNTEFFKDVQKPEICNILIPTSKYIYQEPILPNIEEQDACIQELKTPTIDQLQTEEVINKFRESGAKVINDKKKFDTFIENFKSINTRKPSHKEIINNLKSKMEMTTLEHFLEEYTVI